MIIELSIAAIAVAFVCLVVYVITTIKSLRQTLEHVNETLVCAKTHIDELGGEGRRIIHQANALSLDVQGKLETLDPLFLTVAHVGEALERKTASFVQSAEPSIPASKNVNNLSPDEESKSIHTLSDILEWIVLGMTLWQKIKKGR